VEVLSRRSRFCFADRLPDLERGCRHRDVAHAERGERVEDGADDVRERRRASSFAAALMPNGLVGESTSTISTAKDGRLSERGIP
jgi:hypothetical protein